MKSFALLLLTCTLSAAQVDSQKLLIQVGAQAMESLKAIPGGEWVRKKVGTDPPGPA